MIADSGKLPLPDGEGEEESGPENDTGAGGEERAESGLTVIHDARMTERAVREGWLKGPWDTHQSAASIRRKESGGHELTIHEETLAIVGERLKSPKELVSLVAARTVVAMEGQNQRERQPANGGVTINNNGPAIQVVKRDDWFGNDAHNRTAEGVAAPAPGAAVSGEVQGPGQRPALGENGNGPAGRN